MCAFSFIACNTDDNNDEETREWKSYQDKIFADAASDYPGTWESRSNNGFIRFKKSDQLTETRVSKEGLIEYSDTVVCRYEGWRFEMNGEKYVFDSTEDRNKIPATFTVNGVIDGWTTALQNMKEGDEYEICVPYKLGYGSSGSTDGSIRGYTTLFFRLYVEKVKPVNPDEHK